MPAGRGSSSSDSGDALPQGPSGGALREGLPPAAVAALGLRGTDDGGCVSGRRAAAGPAQCATAAQLPQLLEELRPADPPKSS